MTDDINEPRETKRRPRRRWRWVAGALVVLLLLLGGLVLLAPTLLSTSPGRALAVSVINSRIDGRIEITGWSLGWRSGARITAMRLLDRADRLMLEAHGINTGLTMLDLVRSKLDFGQTDVARVTFAELRFLEEGDTNIQRMITGRPPDPAEADEPLEIPLFRGRIQVASFAGPFVLPDLPQFAGAPRVIYIDDGMLTVEAADFGQPITHALQLGFRYGESDPGQLRMSGQIDPTATEALAMLRQLEFNLDHPQAEALWAIFEPMLADTAGELPPPRITRGALAVSLAITQNGQVSHITGDTTLANLHVIRGDQVILDDDRLEIRQDVQLDLANESLSIGELIVALRRGAAAEAPADPGAEAGADAGAVLQLAVTGGVTDYAAQRNLDDIRIMADYDLGPLVELLRPFLPEAMVEVQVAGRAQREFTITGRLPAELDFAEALHYVIGDGSLLVPDAEYAGLHISGLDLPLRFQEMVVHVAGAPPAECNEGVLQIPDLTIDLSGEVPLLTAAETQLLQNVSINPVVADTLLGPYFNPMFLDPEQAGGRLNVHLIAAENLPLSDIMLEPVPANIGRAELALSLHEVNIGSQFVGRFLPRSHVQGQIPQAHVRLEAGRLSHEMTMQVERYAIGFAGDMRLSDLHYSRLDVSVPRDQLPRWLREQLPGDVMRLLPEQLTMPFSGPVTDLRIAPEFVPRLAEQALQRGLVERLPLPGRNGRQRDPDQEPGQEQEPPPAADPLRQMMDRLLDRQRR